MKKNIFLVFLLLCWSCFFAKQSIELKVKISICDIKATEFCYRVAPKEIIVILGFKINNSGVPIDVVKLSPSQPLIEFSTLKDCLNNWKIEGAEKNSKFIAKWKFRYGIWENFKLESSGEKIIELDFNSLKENSITIYKRI
jgi:hypothetical protein